MSSDFSKYRERGAYHWTEISKNPLRAWPYTRSRVRWVIDACGSAEDVLEIGCGDGAILGLLARRGKRVTGIDSEPTAIELAKEMFEKHGLTGTFGADVDIVGQHRFDAVVLAEVIEHVERPEELLTVIKKHLTAEGRFVLTTPVRLLERSLDPHHVHEFWPGELEGLLRDHFEEVRIEKMHPAWLIDLMCYSIGSFRLFAAASNLVFGLTGVELLDRLPSPLGLYWTQGAVCRGARAT